MIEGKKVIEFFNFLKDMGFENNEYQGFIYFQIPNKPDSKIRCYKKEWDTKKLINATEDDLELYKNHYIFKYQYEYKKMLIKHRRNKIKKLLNENIN